MYKIDPHELEKELKLLDKRYSVKSTRKGETQEINIFFDNNSIKGAHCFVITETPDGSLEVKRMAGSNHTPKGDRKRLKKIVHYQGIL